MSTPCVSPVSTHRHIAECVCVLSLFITLCRRIKEEKTFCVASDSNSTLLNIYVMRSGADSDVTTLPHNSVVIQ